MNKVILLGRLVRDPEIRYSAGAEQKAVANFTIAVDRKYKRDGEPQADFIPCTAFGKSAEFVDKYLRKGIKIALEGHWRTDSYNNSDGHKVYTNNCIVESMEFAESKKSESSVSGPEPQPTPDENGFMNIPDGIDDEVPFA